RGEHERQARAPRCINEIKISPAARHPEDVAHARFAQAFDDASGDGRHQRNMVLRVLLQIADLKLLVANTNQRLPTSMTVELHEDLRRAVRDLCKAFPDSYWRELDARRAYPDAFVAALTGAWYLAALIPEEYCGSGLGITDSSI